jgi:hypothetical protein
MSDAPLSPHQPESSSRPRVLHFILAFGLLYLAIYLSNQPA